MSTKELGDEWRGQTKKLVANPAWYIVAVTGAVTALAGLVATVRQTGWLEPDRGT
jgi:hypothetical protein